MTRTLTKKTVSIQYCTQITSQCNQQSRKKKRKEKAYRLLRKKQSCHYSLLMLSTYQIKENKQKETFKVIKEDAGYEINI